MQTPRTLGVTLTLVSSVAYVVFICCALSTVHCVGLFDERTDHDMMLRRVICIYIHTLTLNIVVIIIKIIICYYKR